MADTYIEIVLNGMKERVPDGTTIGGLIRASGEKDAHLIVELNNRFVFPHTYESTAVSTGDAIEFINPDFGG